MKIEDGKGSGKLAQVDSTNRLSVDAKTHSEVHDIATEDGQVYMFSTNGFITISSTGTETGILYIKNTSATKFLVINAIRTCGTVVQKVKFYRNSTAGTLISGASNGQITNTNFTSSNAAEATCYKGTNGSTLTDGTHLGNHINGIGHSTVYADDAIILGRNDTFSITFELASSGDVCAAVVGYFSAS